MFRRPAFPYQRGVDEFVLLLTAAGDYDENGEWVPGTEVEHAVMGTAAPMTAEMALRSLPEGKRTAGAFQFWLVPPAGVRIDPGQVGERSPARIQYRGRMYQVESASEWEPGWMELTCVWMPEEYGDARDD